MIIDSEDVPLPAGKPVIGLIYNVKKDIKGELPDEEAEFDSYDNVCALAAAIKNTGADVIMLEADKELPEKLVKTKMDMAFSIAEGFNGRAREAQVQAILEMLGIPYVGADQTALCVALDKQMCKRYLSSFGILAPKAQLISDSEEKITVDYPVILKPNAEGSGKGISENSIAENEEQLRSILRKELSMYKQPVLVEEYIDGREFTVGIIGKGEEAEVFAPMEIVYRKPTQGNYKVYSYKVKCEYDEFVDYECPAKVDNATDDEMRRVTRLAFDALGCRDLSRADFRVSNDNKVYFIEINPLPGLAPEYSDYPAIAKSCGTEYNELIARILYSAYKRYGIKARA